MQRGINGLVAAVMLVAGVWSLHNNYTRPGYEDLYLWQVYGPGLVLITLASVFAAKAGGKSNREVWRGVQMVVFGLIATVTGGFSLVVLRSLLTHGPADDIDAIVFSIAVLLVSCTICGLSGWRFFVLYERPPSRERPS